jgi:hypothetical protein
MQFMKSYFDYLLTSTLNISSPTIDLSHSYISQLGYKEEQKVSAFPIFKVLLLLHPLICSD